MTTSSRLAIAATIIYSLVFSATSVGQVVLRMEKVNGVYTMPCKVNGLSLKFIFDTGASSVSISLTEALFMLKNGYLKESDLLGTEYYQFANGDVGEGTEILLREIDIGGVRLNNVRASITHSMGAPLLLGQSALSRLGRFQMDYATNTLTLLDKATSAQTKGTYTASGPPELPGRPNPPDRVLVDRTPPYSGTHLYKTNLPKGTGDAPLRDLADINARVIYRCEPGSTIYVIENTNEVFSKVFVGGHTGFLSKAFLVRKE